MNIPCPDRVDCGTGPSVNGFDWPITNYSSEDPDRPVNIAVVWGDGPPPIDGVPPPVPPPGRPCFVIATSFESIETAQYCAIRANVLCSSGESASAEVQTDCEIDNRTNPPDPPPVDPTRFLFGNHEQTCTVNCPEGGTFSYTVRAGTFLSVSQTNANNQAHSLACRKAQLERICLGELFDWLCSGETLVGQTIEIVRGLVPPYVFEVTDGQLPPGITIASDGFVAGACDSPGSYTFTVRATDTNGLYGEKQYTVSIFGITNPNLPDGTVGTAYSQQLATSGGTAPVTFALGSGSSLPAGLSLSSTGLISGTPTAATTTPFNVTITDADDGVCTQSVSVDVVGCVFGCGPEQNILTGATNNDPAYCSCDRNSGLVYGAMGDAVLGSLLVRLDTTALAITAQSVVEPLEGIADVIWHPSDGRLYVPTTDGAANSHIHRVNPTTMLSEASAVPALTAIRVAVDDENNRVYYVGQNFPPASTFNLNALDIGTMAMTNIDVGGPGVGFNSVAYIPATSSLSAGTVGLIASGVQGSQLTFYRADTYAMYSFITMPGEVVSLVYNPNNDELVVVYLNGANWETVAFGAAFTFATTTANPFVAPAIGATIQIDLVTAMGLIPDPFPIFIGGTQWQLVSVDNATQVTVRNLTVVMGTPVPAGTAVTGFEIAAAAVLLAPTATGVSASWCQTEELLVLAQVNHLYGLDPITHALVCDMVPATTANHYLIRCDTDGRCKLVIPWNRSGFQPDSFKIY